MAAEHVPGATADVRVVIVAVNTGAQTADVRVIDDNGDPLTATVTLPMSLVRVSASPVAISDVLEELATGITAVVRWVDPASPIRWSPSPAGSPARSSLGWRKVGTFTPPP